MILNKKYISKVNLVWFIRNEYKKLKISQTLEGRHAPQCLLAGVALTTRSSA